MSVTHAMRGNWRAQWDALVLPRVHALFFRRPWLLVSLLFTGYALVFVPIYLTVGAVVGALGIMVSVLAGFLLKPAGRIAFGIVLASANSLLYSLFEPFYWTYYFGGVGIVLLACAAGGLARRAWDRMERQKRELDAANQRLITTQSLLVQTAKLATIGELAAGVGHEINQPLQIISLAAEGALAAPPEEAGPETRDALELILSQTRRASAIITHLKAIGRKADPAEKRPGNLNTIVQGSLLLFSNRWREADIDLNLRLGEGLPLVSCNAVLVEQVLMNLYLNATDALERRPERRIDIRTGFDGSHSYVEVQDSGAGIPPEVKDKVFDPFFTTKPVGKGTGLGLSISHRIMADHGGFITASSEPGSGATFRIGLPADPAA